MRCPFSATVILLLMVVACSSVNLPHTLGTPAPTQVNISSENLKLAAAHSAANDGISMLVMVNGKIVFEDYPNPGGPNRFQELASATKSFSCAMAVAAVDDGLLKLDERVAETITEWREDSRKSKMTIRQLLSLTGGQATGDERGDVPTYAQAIQAPAIFEPGEKFQYGAVPFQVFGEVMRRKLESRKQSPLDYLKQRVFDPIGLRVGNWTMGKDGNPHLPAGARLTAREWAKYGELIRLGGTWESKQILSAATRDECFRGTPQDPAYGLTWWLNRDVSADLRATIRQLTAGTEPMWDVPDIPRDLVFAAGAGKQRLFVSRSLNLVVVRQATGILESLAGTRRSAFSDAEFLSLLLTGKSVKAK
ncbi:MAG: serine hydrolase [Chloroflexi bacterium]|nr:serine hydrolase [Chloroflexota bacterium]